MGQYALHWACTNPSKDNFTAKICLSMKLEVKSIDNYNILKVIQLLVGINPISVLEKDVYGRPIVIAKRNLAKDYILRFLEECWIKYTGYGSRNRE
jgi:hypothetical protein